jgi:HK97 family phage major capsid protein
MIKKTDAYALFEPDVINEIIEGAVKQSAVLQMFRRLPNMTSNKTKMRVLDSLPMAYWVDADTNNGRKKLTKMAWDNKFITAEELAVIVPIKEDVLDDADYDIWADVRPRIQEAMGKAIDDAVLTGKNKPNGFRTDLLTSILNAGSVVSQGADQTLYSAINDAMVKVEESGYNPSGIVGGVDVKGKFRMMLDTSGQPIAGTEIGNLPKFYVDNGSWDKTKSQMIVGDFSQAVYSIRQDVTYKILDQAIIQDPASGDILYNLAQEDMVALRVVMRLGWEIPNPINALNPDEETRFPFASIAPTSGNSLTTQTVTVTVKDNAGTPAPIAGAKVTVGGVSKKTNASGVATFKLQAGEYPMMVKHDGMVATDVVTVASTAVSKAVTLK